MKIKTLTILLFAPFITLQAQNTKEDIMSNILWAGGNYYSYPTPKGKLTPAPAGYKPFYISHYSRHGSRYMCSNQPYKNVIAKLEAADKANVLTAFGKDILNRAKIAYKDAYHRDGDLSTLGARQHQGIALRMYKNYPEVLTKPIKVDAKSSTIMRSALSMSNFCQQLRSMNPKLQISMTASKSTMWYIANGEDSIKMIPEDTVMQKRHDAFKLKMFHPERMMSLLFKDKDYVKKEINSIDMMNDFYNIAEDMQCLPELNLSFYDLFTKEELFNIWQWDSASWCLWKGFFSSTTPRYKAQFNLLRNIIDTADKAIASGGYSVTLRFGHDSIVIPLAYILHLNGCDQFTDDLDSLYKYWGSYNVAPMAANIQLIFYRKAGSKDVLVKFLLNENEKTIPVKTNCAPYYHWKDVKAFYENELKN
jgi:hypothetical protein